MDSTTPEQATSHSESDGPLDLDFSPSITMRGAVTYNIQHEVFGNSHGNKLRHTPNHRPTLTSEVSYFQLYPQNQDQQSQEERTGRNCSGRKERGKRNNCKGRKLGSEGFIT